MIMHHSRQVGRHARAAAAGLALTAIALASTVGGVAPEPAHADDATRTVITSGDIRLATALSDGELGLGFVDATDPAEPKQSSLADTVIWVDDQDAQFPWANEFTRGNWSSVYPEEGGLAWRTGFNTRLAADDYRLGGNRDLVISLDAGLVDGAAIEGNVFTHLAEAQTPNENTYFSSYRVTRDGGVPSTEGFFHYWDSRPDYDQDRFYETIPEHGTGVSGTKYVGNDDYPVAGAISTGWFFSQPGVYCLTVQSWATEASDGDTLAAHGTITVAVGEDTDATSVPLCAQQDEEPALPIDDDGDGLNPDVHWLREEHTDITVKYTDATETAIHYVLQQDDAGYAISDTVVVIGDQYGKKTVPAPTEQVDYSFIGASGSEYWAFNETSLDRQHNPWLGFGLLLDPSTLDSYPDRNVRTTVLGIQGADGAAAPGEVVVYKRTAAEGEDGVEGIYFNSRDGLPKAIDTEGHAHMGWAFTAPGVYCVNLEAELRTVAGSTLIANSQLTVAVGDSVDLTQVEPCDWNTAVAGAVGVPKAQPALELADESATTFVQSGSAALTPYIDAEGDLQVAYVLREDANSPVTAADPDDLIVTTTAVKQTSGILAGYGASPSLVLDASRSELAGRVQGDLAVELDAAAAQAPGSITFRHARSGRTAQVIENANGSLAGYEHVGRNVLLSTDADDPVTSYQQWTGWRLKDVYAVASAYGLYCIPVTWSATVDGSTKSISKTLSYLYLPEGTELADTDYANGPACGQGAVGDAPDDSNDPGSPDEGAWDVPNWSLTESGARILNNDHVDVASVIDDGVLDTLIKDTTAAALGSGQLVDGAVWHEPEEVVFQFTPASRHILGSSPTLAFLGDPGTVVWSAPESQLDGVLWPGWSTEAIAESATSTDFDWRLTGFEGPGDFYLFVSNPVDLGSYTVLYNTADGVDDDDAFAIEKHLHAHGNWTFTAEGVYCLDFERSATLTGESAAQTDAFTLAVAVGRADPTTVDPKACVGSGLVEPTPTVAPTAEPTVSPTAEPTASPTAEPTATVGPTPTGGPAPTGEPEPTGGPQPTTPAPTVPVPTGGPEPTDEPEPTGGPVPTTPAPEPTEPGGVVVTPDAPGRVGNTISIPVVEGVEYYNAATGRVLTGSVELHAWWQRSVTIGARAADGYVLADGAETSWSFSYEHVRYAYPRSPSRVGDAVAIPNVPGVEYRDEATGASLRGLVSIPSGSALTVVAVAQEGYAIAPQATTSWTFTARGTSAPGQWWWLWQWQWPLFNLQR